MEMIQFGFEPEARGEMQTAVELGRPAVEIIKALLVQELGIPSLVLAPPEVALLTDSKSRRKQQNREEHDKDQDTLM